MFFKSPLTPNPARSLPPRAASAGRARPPRPGGLPGGGGRRHSPYSMRLWQPSASDPLPPPSWKHRHHSEDVWMWSLDCSQPRPASAMMSKAMALSRSRGRIHRQRSQARPQRSISTADGGARGAGAGLGAESGPRAPGRAQKGGKGRGGAAPPGAADSARAPRPVGRDLSAGTCRAGPGGRDLSGGRGAREAGRLGLLGAGRSPRPRLQRARPRAPRDLRVLLGDPLTVNVLFVVSVSRLPGAHGAS